MSTQPRRHEDFHSYLVGQGYLENSENELILDSCSHYDAVFGKQKRLQCPTRRHDSPVPPEHWVVPTGWHLSPSPRTTQLSHSEWKKENLAVWWFPLMSALWGWFVGRAYLELEITLSQEQIQKYTDCLQFYVNNTLKELRRLFLVQDLVDSLKVRLL